MYLDGRDVTGDFSLRYSTELSGVKGLRQMRFTTELFTYSARFSSTDDGRVLQCIAAVPGLPANATSARLNVQCKIIPLLSLDLILLMQALQNRTNVS